MSEELIAFSADLDTIELLKFLEAQLQTSRDKVIAIAIQKLAVEVGIVAQASMPKKGVKGGGWGV